MKKEYTRKIQNIWQAFYDHDEKRISQIQKEILLRLNKYCDFINDRCLQSNQLVNDDYYERSVALTRRLIDYYNLPKKIWVPDLSDVGIIPKSRIRLYERYVNNNYCKGIFAKDGDYDWGEGFNTDPIHYMEHIDDLDLLYIFFDVPLEAAYDWPKSFYYLGRGFAYYQVLYHIENRIRWKEGFSEEEWNNGNLCTSGHYVNGLPNGVWKLVSPDGKKHHFIEWKEGYINGINYFYDPETSVLMDITISKNGQFLLSSKHEDDIKEIKKRRVPARQVDNYQYNMLNHPFKKRSKKKHGKFKEGTEDWYFEGKYDNNKPVGVWKEYLDGKLIYELAYKDGEIDLENSIFRYRRNGTPIPWNIL